MRDPGKVLAFDEYELDFGRAELRRHGKPVGIQPTPLRLLLYLAEHRDRTVSRSELLDAVWPDAVVGDDALTTALKEARHAVGDAGAAQRVIRTQKGAGYRFVAELLGTEDAEEVARGRVAHRQRPRRNALVAGIALVALCALAAAWLRPWRADAPPAPVPFGVAVVPITNVTGDARDEKLASGLTLQITQALGANGYPVVAPKTAAEWQGRAADLRELGRELDVSHVLEGSVQRDGERRRVTVQLASTATGKHMWSETFEVSSGELFAIQDRITTRVALEVYRHVWEDIAAMERDPALAEIAKWALESRKLQIAERHEDSLAASQRLLEVMPEREPFLVLRGVTLSMMSFSWAQLYQLGSLPFADAGPKMLALARAGVGLAPEHPATHFQLSRTLCDYWQWEECEREMRRPCEIAPRDGGFCGSIKVHVCARLGCIEEALAAARMFVEQNPAEWTSWALLAHVLTNAGRLAEAESALLRARELFEPSAILLPTIQWRLGKREEAVESLRRWLATSSASADGVRALDRIRGAGPEAVWRWFAEHEAGEGPVFSPANLNQALAAEMSLDLGDHEAALRAAERSVAEHEAGLAAFALDPAFDPIRETPRFRALIEQMGLTAYHAKYLRLPRN